MGGNKGYTYHIKEKTTPLLGDKERKNMSLKTVKEVKEAKSELEKSISLLITKFEQDNDVEVSGITMEKIGIYNGVSLNAECLTIKTTVEV